MNILTKGGKLEYVRFQVNQKGSFFSAGGYFDRICFGGSSILIQVFVFTMYNPITDEYFPTYCCDINVAANQGTDYRRLNLEDSPFSASASGQILSSLQKTLQK